jgi:ABC-type transporter Mla subunit MlaD
VAYLKEEIKAGVIVVAAFFILSGFVILIGGSQLFEKLDRYVIRVTNAAGIEEGTQVKLGGVRIGRVVAVTPPAAPGDPVTITLGVKKGIVLYKGTRASVSQVGIMGDLFILLSIDTVARTAKEQFHPGETIPVEEQIQLATVLARVDGLARSVEGVVKEVALVLNEQNIKEIESLLKNANSTLTSGSANIEKVANTLKGTAARLEQVLGETEGLVKETRSDLSPLLKRAREGVEKAGEMIRTLDETAKGAHATFRTADKAISRQSQNLDILLLTLNRTTEDLRETLHELKSKPWGVVYKEEQGKEE